MLTGFTDGWRWSVAALVVAAVAIAGCGSDSSSDTSTDATDASATSTTEEGEQPVELKPVEPPKAKESIADAQKRIAKVLASGDCDEIVKLGPLTRQPPSDLVETRCNLYETRLGSAEPSANEAFDDGGGVIDYSLPANDLTAVMLLDQDGLYHVAFMDPFLGGGSVGTKQSKQFDKAAEASMEALRERDCEAFLAAANRRFGPGALEKSAACQYVENNPIAGLYEAAPDAKLESFGGNGDYAFYGIAGPGAHYTLVLGRESNADAPANAPALPDDAPEYGLLSAFRTNVKSGSQ